MASAPAPTEQDVLDALQGVKDPDIQRDLVELGMIKDIRVADDSIALTVNLTTPACPRKAEIEQNVRTALEQRLGQERSYQITMGAEVRGRAPVAERNDLPGVKNVIAVGSGKGGVGKSSVAASIAYGLQSFGTSVGLMDADVYGPSIPHLVGASDRPTLAEDRIQPVVQDGLKLISTAFLMEPEQAMVMRGPRLHGIVLQFLHKVDWGELDYLIIDLPPGTGDVPLSLGQALPLTGAVIVCTPQQVALLDAVRATTMFRQLKVPLLGMVENMSDYEGPDGTVVRMFGKGGARTKAEELGIPYLGEIPLVGQFREWGDLGQIGRAIEESSPMSPYLLNVVKQLAAQVSIQNIKTQKVPGFEILN